MMKQNDTFDPSFFEKLKITEDRYFWFQVRRWIFAKITNLLNLPQKSLRSAAGRAM
jgi:hypothetical protein